MRTVIEMAREAGFAGTASEFYMQELERFAELVRADERKTCLARIQILPNPHEYCQVSERAHNMAAAAFCAAIQAIDKV